VIVEFYDPSPNDQLVTTFNIEVPVWASPGPTMLRCMSMFAASVPQPCGTHSWGETENYQLTVVGSCSAPSNENRPSLCAVKDITNSGFRVICAVGNTGVPGATSFSFYATD